MISAFRNCLSLVNPIFSCRFTYSFLVALLLKIKVQLQLFNNCNRASTIIWFEIDQKSSTHTSITSRNDTDFKDVISYLVCSHVLNLRARTVAVITITMVVSKQQFGRPKLPIQTQDKRKLVHISTA